MTDVRSQEVESLTEYVVVLEVDIVLRVAADREEQTANVGQIVAAHLHLKAARKGQDFRVNVANGDRMKSPRRLCLR